MISVEDVKEELRMDMNDSSDDNRIQKIITRQENFLKSYCNNEELDFSSGLLDDIVMYLVIRASNPDTSLRAGKASESNGTSLSFLTDLPTEYKMALMKHRKLKFSVVKSDYEDGGEKGFNTL